MISFSAGGDHLLIGIMLLGRGLTSSLLAGGWSVGDVAHLAGFGLLVCSHYGRGLFADHAFVVGQAAFLLSLRW